MRKLLLFFPVMLFASCTDYGQCSGDKMYHMHSFSPVSMTKHYYLKREGWIKEKCQKCGLELMSSELDCKSHFGSVVLVKAPGSNDFTELCVYYYEDGEEHIKPISESEIK